MTTNNNNPRPTTISMNTVLKCAVIEKNLREVIRALRKGANPNIECGYYETILEYLMLEMDTSDDDVRNIARTLIEYGTEVDRTTLYRSNCIEVMIWYVQKHFTAIPEMLEELFLDACEASETYDTLPLLRVCVSLGVNPKATNDRGGVEEHLMPYGENYEEIRRFLTACGAI